MKISNGDMHLLRLIDKDKTVGGWAKVSNVVMPLVVRLPPELVTIEKHKDGSGHIKLTEEGETVLKWS